MKSSTEAYLVGMIVYVPFNIRIIMFIGAQGYGAKTNILSQDNQSEIRMEVNVRNLCTSNLRYINIVYLFVKERVKKENGGKLLSHTPDFCSFFKYLQGILYELFQNIIMGHSSIDVLFQDYSFPPNERVENYRIFQVLIEN